MLKKYHNKYFIEKFLRPTLEEFNKNGKLNNKDGVLFTGIVGSAVIHQIYKESEHDESYDIKIREPAIRVSQFSNGNKLHFNIQKKYGVEMVMLGFSYKPYVAVVLTKTGKIVETVVGGKESYLEFPY